MIPPTQAKYKRYARWQHSPLVQMAQKYRTTQENSQKALLTKELIARGGKRDTEREAALHSMLSHRLGNILCHAFNPPYATSPSEAIQNEVVCAILTEIGPENLVLASRHIDGGSGQTIAKAILFKQAWSYAAQIIRLTTCEPKLILAKSLLEPDEWFVPGGKNILMSTAPRLTDDILFAHALVRNLHLSNETPLSQERNWRITKRLALYGGPEGIKMAAFSQLSQPPQTAATNIAKLPTIFIINILWTWYAGYSERIDRGIRDAFTDFHSRFYDQFVAALPAETKTTLAREVPALLAMGITSDQVTPIDDRCSVVGYCRTCN